MARMTRTQIMLEPRQMKLLEQRSRIYGTSKSELIRAAIDIAYDEEAAARRRHEAWQRFQSRKYSPEEAAPKDTSPNWRENLHDRGPGGRGW